jgi:transposase
LKETFEPLKAAAHDQNRYYFVDATHPTHNPVLTYRWALRGHRPPVLTNTARQRLNILGAYCPYNQTYVGLETTQNIDAQSVLELIIQRLETHQPTGHITLILDNARYNHARILRDYVQSNPRLTLVYLPPYSPNLNLIERLWGFMKKTVLCTYFPTFEAFCLAIRHFFNHLDLYHSPLDSLLTENFTILNSV